MDSCFGICGKDWVIICADTSVNRSIFVLKHDEDKIEPLNKYKLLGCSGEQTERYQFAQFIKRNLQLQEFRTGHEPDVESTAQWMRSEMAAAIRSRSPYQVNCLMGGYDVIEEEAKLYTLDYLGSLQQVNKGAHGYCGYFVSSVLDQYYKHGMTPEEGIFAIKQCIVELRKRFMIQQPTFSCKIVTKDGAHQINLE